LRPPPRNKKFGIGPTRNYTYQEPVARDPSYSSFVMRRAPNFTIISQLCPTFGCWGRLRPFFYKADRNLLLARSTGNDEKKVIADPRCKQNYFPNSLNGSCKASGHLGKISLQLLGLLAASGMSRNAPSHHASSTIAWQAMGERAKD
jgi:hypothetical protein